MGWPAPHATIVGIVVGLRERSGSMDIVIIEIDLDENSCSLAGMDALGRVVLRRRMRRSSLESFAKGLGRCMIAMEACCGGQPRLLPALKGQCAYVDRRRVQKG